jgi:type IV secretory pathway TrbF-like protein
MSVLRLRQRAAPAQAALPKTDNPYLNARREWNERYGEYIVRERAWRSVALFSLGIAAIAAGGLVWVAGQTKVVPYVVEVNKLGDAVAVRPADHAPRPDDRIIRAQLARWIEEVRSVYLDAAAEHNAIRDAYSMINQHGMAFGFLNDTMRDPENNPFERAATMSVSVDVQSVLPLSPDTWRVEWLEITRDRGGHELNHAIWAATISIVVRAPSDEKSIRANPTGIFVNSLNWSKRLPGSMP